VLPLVPLGLLSFGAFLYTGIKARHRPWIVAGVVYAAVLYAGFLITVSSDDDSLASNVGITLVLVAWGVSLVHAFAIRGRYLERMELLEGGEYDRAEDRLEEREEARRLAREEPERALELGIGRPDRSGFDGGLVDLNNAPADVIEELAGVNRELAERIVATREDVGGFSSLDDLAQVCELPVALVDRIRADVVLLPRGTRG
jgi:competence ComEA-like helix-hairpin-helix protein